MAVFYGVDADGRTYSDHLFQGGGQGGSHNGDGHSALLYPTSAANTSVELFETRVPALVEQKAFLPDSAGPGERRGGFSQIIVVRKLEDDGQPCQVGLYPNGVTVSTKGLFGGESGARARAWISKEEGEKLDLGVGGISQLLTKSQRAHLVLAGGLITAEGARENYGCVVDGEGNLDQGASEALRQESGRAETPTE
jgi:5-oxoprolinase (ATP-hydrolysing)/N-methylhydantoinase A